MNLDQEICGYVGGSWHLDGQRRVLAVLQTVQRFAVNGGGAGHFGESKNNNLVDPFARLMASETNIAANEGDNEAVNKEIARGQEDNKTGEIFRRKAKYEARTLIGS